MANVVIALLVIRIIIGRFFIKHGFLKFKDGRSFVKITEPRLYNLFDGEYGDYKLTLKVKEGFSFNAFTFG